MVILWTMRWWLPALWAAGGILAAAQGQELSSTAMEFIETHFAAAKQAEAFEQFPKAIQEYELIIRKYPKAVPEVYQNLGLIFYLERRYDEAIGAFERGRRLKPGMPGSRLFLGASYVLTERPEPALPHLESAHKTQPTIESATFLGLALTALKRYDEANRLFRFALPLSPKKDYYLHLLGNGYLKMSEQVFNRFSERHKDSKYEHLMMAMVVDSQQWYQIAAKEYLEAAKRDPMNASLFMPLARWLVALGLDKPAEMAFERYRRLVPLDREAKLNKDDLPKKELADVGIKVDYLAELSALPPVDRANLPPLPILTSEVNEEVRKRLAGDSGQKWKPVVEHLLHSRWKQATEALESMRPGPNDWLRDYLLALVWLWQDDASQAEEIARRLKTHSEEIPAIEMLRWDIYRQRSFQYFQRLLDEYPESAWAHFVKARNLDAQGKREALDEYKAAIAADPALPDVRIALTDYYLSNSNIEAALAESQKELEFNPYSTSAKVRIGRIYVELQEPQKGIPYIQEALKGDPEDANARADLARGLDLLGQTEKAIAEYKRALELDSSLNRLHYVLARLYRKTGRPELAEREYQIFQSNEATARQQNLERVRRLRESEALKASPQAKP
jgi:tetratricopeptide (TPR) repeat protein